MTKGDPRPALTQDALQNQKRQPAPGRLKIFLGYAAGVGKTYAMLQAARQRQAQGADLAVAYLEVDCWPENIALAQGLEFIPPVELERDGVTLTELNLDAALARRPRLALVDGLAHGNAPGLRHAKRYQDVQELLEAGIDVWTTLNIQHLASLNDVVARITGVTIRETVPDHIIDQADAVELVDLPPAELWPRLQQNRRLLSEPDGEKFFRPGNLLALRQLALRRAADRVDEQMRAYMQSKAIAGPWPANERLLVCVSPSPLSRRLVRAGRRLAARLDAEWFVVYVETPAHARLSPVERDRVAQTLQLAESLGAKAVTLTGHSVAETVVEFARARNVTRVVAGKPLRPRWTELWRGSIVDQIIRRSGDLDIYVISSATEQPEAKRLRPVARRPQSWRPYAHSIGLVAAATLSGLPLRALIEPTNLVMLYLLAVVIAAVQLGRRPAMLASLVSIVAFNFVFVPPYYTYAVADAQFLLTFAGLLMVGIVISTLAAQAREQARAARRRETQTSALYEFSRDLAGATELEAITQTAVIHLERVFGGHGLALLSDRDRLDFDREHLADLAEVEQAAVQWAFEHGQPAGQGTDTFAEINSVFLPLQATRSVVGVLGARWDKPAHRLTAEQWRLLESFARQTAQAIERVQLAQEARQAQLLRETEKLQTALLNSISHDLRTPLASITGSLSSLRYDAPHLDETARTILVNTAWEQADRLNNLVGNLLEMTRLEAGRMKVRLELCDVQEVIGVALEQVGYRLDGRPVEVDAPDNLPATPLDLVLVAQVLVNLLDNALKYSPPTGPIVLRARQAGAELIIEVMDEGVGIPEQELNRIFDKFYRLPHPSGISGTGLGLSISKGIIEAHHGRIWAENRAGGGAKFSLALPLES